MRIVKSYFTMILHDCLLASRPACKIQSGGGFYAKGHFKRLSCAPASPHEMGVQRRQMARLSQVITARIRVYSEIKKRAPTVCRGGLFPHSFMIKWLCKGPCDARAGASRTPSCQLHDAVRCRACVVSRTTYKVRRRQTDATCLCRWRRVLPHVSPRGSSAW